MKTIQTPEVPALGIDQRFQAPDNTASDIVNMRLDDTGFGYINDKGYEPFIPLNAHSTSYLSLDSYDRTFVWTRHRDAELYVLSKRGSQISYEVCNNSGLLSTIWKEPHTIAYNRTPAKKDDPGEQFVPFGRLCLILNGIDPMLKFWGRDRTEPFGFTSATPRPEVLGPDPLYFDGTCDLGAAPPTSTYPYNENDTIGGISFGPGSGAGLGNPAADEVSYYRYKISFITDTGSESPLSEYVQVGWDNKVDGLTYSTFFQHLPMGPPGTVARRIYRTKNMQSLRGDSLVDDTYYLVDEISDNVSRNYYDSKPDQLLVVLAPASTDSSVISSGYKYGANWDGRMWLAGGTGNETKIIYSVQGLPEQFPTFNFFDVGNKRGGAITGMASYYDNLLIFRESAIEIIRSDNNGRYLCTTVSSNIGTTATNTITAVQGLGVFFLSYDGMYIFDGGVLGGSRMSVTRISDKIAKEMSRISKGSLAKASAAYSDKEKEWWCIYPVDGQTVPTRSSVYHVLNGTWSFRNEAGLAGSFPWNDISVLPSGWFILSPRISVTLNSPVIGQATVNQSGLMIWSAKKSSGQTLVYDMGEGSTIVGVSDKPPLTSVWQSAWFDFGDDRPVKRILSVEVEVLTAGHNEIELFSATDYRDDNTSAGFRPTAVATQYGTTSEDSLFAPATGTFDKSVAIIGTSKWGEKRSTRVRWDVSTGLVSWYRFTLRSSELFQVVSFVIQYTVSDMPTLNITAGQRKTP